MDFDGIVDSNSGPSVVNPAVRRAPAAGPAGPVRIVLDQAADITAELAVRDDGMVMLVIHDPKRSPIPDEDEVWALPLAPGPAGVLGAELSRMARHARGRRPATEPGA